MKKLLFVSVLSLLSLGAFAQGGSWYVGGAVGFGSENDNFNNNQSRTTWSFSPEVGTFLNEKWSVGIALGIEGANTKDDNGDVSKMSGFKPDLYGRRWWKAGERLSLFAGLDVAFGSGSFKTYPANQEVSTSYSSFGIDVNAGVAYSLAERWTLLFKFAGLGYRSETIGDETTTGFGLTADGNITSNQFLFIGLYWNFIQP